MGIGRVSARDAIAAIKAGTSNRTALRAQLGEAVDALNEVLAKLDAQTAKAEADFAKDKAAQFKAFADALPDVVDVVNP